MILSSRRNSSHGAASIKVMFTLHGFYCFLLFLRGIIRASKYLCFVNDKFSNWRRWRLVENGCNNKTYYEAMANIYHQHSKQLESFTAFLKNKIQKNMWPQCQAAGMVVKIRIHCQLNTPASLQSPALPHYVIFSAQPIVVRTNKILLTNFYFFGKFSSSSCSHST